MTVRIIGSGDRDLLLEQAERLGRIIAALAREIEGGRGTDLLRIEVCERIARHRADERAIRAAIAEFDARPYQPSPANGHAVLPGVDA